MTVPADNNSSNAPVANAGQSELSAEEARKRAIAAKLVAASFGEIVSLLMRSPFYRHYALQDLEWLVLPAVAAGQYAIAEGQSKQTGMVTAFGAVLWAFVSPEVDAHLEQTLSQPPRLKPQDWRSGDIPWIVEALGEPKIINGLLSQVAGSPAFKGRSVKMRVRDKSGQVTIGLLEPKAKTPQETITT